MEEQFTEEQSMDLIRSMVRDARIRFRNDSFFYLLWGWLVLAAAIANYAMLMLDLTKWHWLPWPVLMFSGGIISWIVGAKSAKKSGVKTHIDNAIMYLWAGFTITLVLVLVAMPKIGPTVAYPIIMLLYGLGTLVSGGILKFKPLIVGSICAFAIGSASFYFTYDIQLLMLIAVVILSYIAPGYWLKTKEEV